MSLFSDISGFKADYKKQDFKATAQKEAFADVDFTVDGYSLQEMGGNGIFDIMDGNGNGNGNGNISVFADEKEYQEYMNDVLSKKQENNIFEIDD